ncbi:MAG: hypothetical protein M1818_005046 [Claussenomyces sp. TS43310]|nr:MAG: hypothetical protein M1818_005046 [Claussenomyces sp. TS43310]
MAKFNPRQIMGSTEPADFSMPDGEDVIPGPYDVRDEEALPEAYFTPDFKKALQQGRGTAKSAANTVKGLMLLDPSCQDTILRKLRLEAIQLDNFQNSETRKIAVLGDSGKEGDIGTACTCVVTEHREKRKEHTARITVVVEHLSPAEIEGLMKELLWSFRRLFLPNAEESQVDAEDYARYQHESHQAWSALNAAFKHQDIFSKEFLAETSEGALKSITDQLILWIQELEWPGGDNELWTSTAETAEEHGEQTNLFMQDRFWPFTKSCETGVVLADLPGLQDTDTAKVRATEKYLMDSDYVFVVAKLCRAVSDQSLKSSIYSTVSRHVPLDWEDRAARLKLAIVCTRSEDLNQKTARRELCGPDRSLPPSVMDQHDKSIRFAEENGNVDLKKTLKRRQKCLLMYARNTHVKKGLQDAYAIEIPGGKLDIFYVSNTAYEKFSAKGNTDMVLISEVPALRRFCRAITAEARLREAEHFLRSKISSLLNSLGIWAKAPPGTSTGQAKQIKRPDI